MKQNKKHAILTTTDREYLTVSGETRAVWQEAVTDTSIHKIS